jgi:hypothetical protein
VDFGGLLVLGLVWLLFNLIGSGKGSRQGRSGGSPRRAPPPPRPAGSPDPTQQEGSMLEQLLRELERNLEGTGGARPAGRTLPAPRRSSGPPPPPPDAGEEEDVEDRTSLEEPERVISLETEPPRRERAAFDHDAEAEATARRRIEKARTRDRALSKADHRAFDARVRQEPADHTAVRRYTPAQLRDAVVWREILGPPVSEREE